MVASFGLVPAAGVAGSAAKGLSSLSASALAESLIDGDLRLLREWTGDRSAARPLTPLATGPVEVVIGLDGRSLAAEQAFRAERGLAPLGPAEQRAYVASLRGYQAGLRAGIEAVGARVIHQYQIVYNGIAVSADAATLGKIASIPGVVRVLPTAVYEIALDNSVPFIFGGQTNADLGADGTGVTIAIIDSGIDYTHAALGGSGDPDDWSDNDRAIIEPGTFPTAKVVGGTDLVGEFYDARGPNPTTRATCTATPVPDPDPLDHNGHGSHVSGIAAGMSFDTFPQGVAPGASLFAIKLFSGCSTDGTASTSTANVIAAIEIATDPDEDGDTSDHVDVINMSLGGAFGRDKEAGAVATNAAVDVGVIVAASAGNGGNIPYITGAPAAASKAISVAAGNDPGVVVQLVKVEKSAGADGDYEALPAAFGPGLGAVKSGVTTFVGQACSALPAGSLADKIPLIARGVCTFVTKIRNAQNAGAIAAVVRNNVPGAGPITMGDDGTGGDIVIPSFMVGTTDGLAIQAAIDGDTTIILDPDNTLPIPNRLQGFTSRGPRFVDSALKPDITAPGGAVFSVEVGTGTGGVSLSGTSMSSPHIAGVAALLRDLHPDWSGEEIKAVIMNTATDASPGGGVPYPLGLMGAGRVRVDVAVDTESVVVPAGASFGVSERDAVGTITLNTVLEVRNKGNAMKKFSLTSSFLSAADNEGSVSFVHPSTLKVGGGQSKSFAFGLTINFNALAPELSFEEYEGFLTLAETTGGADMLRVPFHIIPMARAHADSPTTLIEVPDGESGSVTVTNTGIRSTVVAAYQFGISDPNEDLIFEGPGMPVDPDDWFDVRHVGARRVPSPFGDLLDFVVTTHGRRTANSMMVTDIWIDVNGRGPDYLVEVADIGLFTTGSFAGQMATALFELTSGSGFLEFGLSIEHNTARQPAPVLLDDFDFLANLIPKAPKISSRDIEYFVVTTDLETGSFDVTGIGTFNAKMPGIFAAVPSFALAAGSIAVIEVFAKRDGGLLLVYSNNIAGLGTSEVVPVDAAGVD